MFFMRITSTRFTDLNDPALRVETCFSCGNPPFGSIYINNHPYCSTCAAIENDAILRTLRNILPELLKLYPEQALGFRADELKLFLGFIFFMELSRINLDNKIYGNPSIVDVIHKSINPSILNRPHLSHLIPREKFSDFLFNRIRFYKNIQPEKLSRSLTLVMALTIANKNLTPVNKDNLLDGVTSGKGFKDPFNVEIHNTEWIINVLKQIRVLMKKHTISESKKSYTPNRVTIDFYVIILGVAITCFCIFYFSK